MTDVNNAHTDAVELSIIVPARNEGENLEVLLREISDALEDGDYELIVVDDNSTDDSKKILENLMLKYARLRPIYRTDGKPGVGRAFREGFKNARGGTIVTMDGDLSHDPRELKPLLDALDDGFDMTIGSRYMPRGSADTTKSRRLISRFYGALSRFLLGPLISDPTSGYRAIRRRALESLSLTSNGFAIHAQIHFKALLAGFRITERPINYGPRLCGKTKLSYLKEGPEYLRVLAEAVFDKLFRQK